MLLWGGVVAGSGGKSLGANAPRPKASRERDLPVLPRGACFERTRVIALCVSQLSSESYVSSDRTDIVC